VLQGLELLSRIKSWQSGENILMKKTMKKTLLFAAALAIAFVIGAVSQTPKTSKHRVVVQLASRSLNSGTRRIPQPPEPLRYLALGH
jgi:hypothetical protein